MARKLFLSFLGTGKYSQCIYYDKAGDYTPTKYIQRATLEQIGAAQWCEGDAVRIFVTKKAREINWVGLNEELSDYLSPRHIDVRSVDIPEGRDEKEIWQIFETIYKEIHKEDELYIDLTHGYRYLPMLMLVLGNYSKFLKNASIQHVSYGNFDAREGNRAPIVDLMPLVCLQDWTTASADFLNNGYVEGMNKLLEGAGEEITQFVRCLDKFVLERQTCRGSEIVSGATERELQEVARTVITPEVPPLRPLLSTIRERISSSAGDEIERIIDAAQWCYDNHLWQQSLSILQEGIVDNVCHRHDCNDRSLVNRAYNISYRLKNKRPKWEVKSQDLPMLLELLDDSIVADEGRCRVFADLSELRNNYMHAGFGRNNPIIPGDINDVIRRVREHFTKCPPYHGDRYKFKKRVFINVSNHPVREWSEIQLSLAKEYGEIEEISFPSVPTNVPKGEKFSSLANDVIREIFKRYDNTTELTVHVMGEMTLTYEIVSRLKHCGIRCVASVSERDSEYLGDGSKISHFHFAGFREY